MTKTQLSAAILLGLFVFIGANAQQPCKAPEIVLNRSQPNIFNEEQEMYLGDVMAEYVQKNYRIIEDPEANRYVRAIGNKLVSHLPPTGIKFQFYVVDLPDLNAFAAAGGRIYITRKMIAFVRSEDELAGIIGHELGHGIVRHSSIDMSRYFKEVLGVERVGDKADIFAKFNQLIESRNTKRIRAARGHEDEQQLEADKVGFYAMAAAGYKPDAFVTAWDRLAETKGKTGSALSNVFGTTRPAEKRLRELVKAMDNLPSSCLEKAAAENADEFKKWQSYVVTTPIFGREAKLKHVVRRGELNPYLRGEIRHFQFSPDGKYILAQDASGINILSREPFSFLFRIEATDAKFAGFSPDSKNVVFQTYGLRVEKWSVESRRPLLAREVFVRGSCWKSAVSPDGSHLVCFSRRASLEIINVETNEKVFEKEKFYVPSFFEYFAWTFSREENGDKEINSMQMEFSPDGRYFLGGRVFRLSTGGSTSFGGVFAMYWGIDADQDAFIAYDLAEKKEMKLGGELRNIVSRPFAFYANDRIIGQHRKDAEKSGIFSFPDGERVEKFYMNADSYTRTRHGDYILVRPTAVNPVGVFDFKQKKLIAGSKTAAMDGYGDVFVTEGKDGIVDLHKVNRETMSMESVGSLTLPKNEFGDVRTIATSAEFDWLILSEPTRSAVWNLRTGGMQIYLRGLRGSYFDPDGKAYVDFPRMDKEPRSMALLIPADNTGGRLEPIETRNTKQIGRYLVQYRSKQDDKLEARRQKAAAKAGKTDAGAVASTGDAEAEDRKVPTFHLASGFLTGLDLGGSLLNDGSLEVSDTVTRKVLWSRVFENEIPRYNFSPENETVSLYWPVSSKAAKAEINAQPALKEKVKSLEEKTGDYLVQVLDANTGAVKGNVLVETGIGSFRIEKVSSAGDWVSVLDSENRILVYSISKGELAWRFFGSSVTLSPVKQIAVVENFVGQLTVFNLLDGRKMEELQFPKSITHVALNPTGTKLFVLTSDQKYYLFDAERFGAKAEERLGE